MDRAQWKQERRLWNEVRMDTDEQVRNWLAGVSLRVLDVVEGDGYRHYLLKK